MPGKPTTKGLNEQGPQQWVMQYADYLYNYAHARLEDEELCKDLVQETFLAALQGWDKFDGRSSEKTWLTGILKNKIYDVYRKRSSPIGASPIAGADPDEFFEADSGHWAAEHLPKAFITEQPATLENKELQGALQTCLNKLPPLWMSVFNMKFIDAAPSALILSTLKLSDSNFWVIMHRAKLSLRECLQKSWVA